MRAIWLAILVVLFADFYHGNFTFNAVLSKLPLAAIPLFVFSFRPDRINVSRINFLILAFLSIATFYSLMNYGFNFHEINENYSKAKVMKVLSYGDHIRISWLIAASILLVIYEWTKTTDTYIKKWMIAYAMVQILFLHILGAKTGLLVLYAILLSVVIYFVLLQKAYRLIWAALLLFAIPILAFKTLPSFQNRLGYVMYDYHIYKAEEYVPGMSDGMRYFSIKGGIDVFKQNLWTGVGFTNMNKAMDHWYSTKMPQIVHSEYIFPSSQILIYAIGGGILGLLAILGLLLSPFFKKSLRTSWVFMAFYPVSICTFLFETHLEGQLPIFACSFLFSWIIYISYNLKQDYKDEEI